MVDIIYIYVYIYMIIYMYCLRTNKRKWGGATLYTSDISSGKAKRAEWTFITLKCPKVELCSLDIDLLTGTYIYQFLDWFGSTKQLMTGAPSIACSKTHHGSPSQQGNTSWWRDLKILCKLSNKWNGLFFWGSKQTSLKNLPRGFYQE